MTKKVLLASLAIVFTLNVHITLTVDISAKVIFNLLWVLYWLNQTRFISSSSP